MLVCVCMRYVCLFVCECAFVWLSVRLLVCWFRCLELVFVCVCVCLFVCYFVCVCQLVCLMVHVFVCLCVCLFVCSIVCVFLN